MPGELVLEVREEAFGHGVVVTIPLAARILRDPDVLARVTAFITGV
jgi:hypothetical protein